MWIKLQKQTSDKTLCWFKIYKSWKEYKTGRNVNMKYKKT